PGLPHIEHDVLHAGRARDGPGTDAGAHLQLFGALVPEPCGETGQPGRARVDADPGRRDLTEDGAPDLADARHGRGGRGRGEAAGGFKREAADLLVDEGAGEVGDDERVQPARLPEPGVAARTASTDQPARHPRVLVRRRPVRIAGAHRPRAAALPGSDDADEEAVSDDTPTNGRLVLICRAQGRRHCQQRDRETIGDRETIHAGTSPPRRDQSANRQRPSAFGVISTVQFFTRGSRGRPLPTSDPDASTMCSESMESTTRRLTRSDLASTTSTETT